MRNRIGSLLHSDSRQTTLSWIDCHTMTTCLVPFLGVRCLDIHMFSSSVVTQSIAQLYTEAYEGAQDPSSTWFTDNLPDAGVLGTLESLSAAQASQSIGDPDLQGSTIAAHTEHLRWSLALANALARGEQSESPWEESWLVRTVNPEEWDRLRLALRSEYRALLQAIQAQSDLPAELVTPGIAIVAHAAYHLGAIRRMVSVVKR